MAHLNYTIGGNSNLVSFKSAARVPIDSLKVHFKPIQDLRGYDHPWPAGGGKNLIPLLIDKIKAINKDKKNWNGDTVTASGITFEFHTNSDGAVNAIVASGTYSEQVNVALGTVKLKAGTDYIINGVPTTPSWKTFQLYITVNGNKYASVSGTQFTVTEDGEYQVYLSIYGSVLNITFHPMIRLATETDGTFAPYSNVCPISGWTGCEVKHSGADTSDPTTLPVTFPSSAGTVYGGYVDLVNGKLVVNRAEVDNISLLSEYGSFTVGNYSCLMRFVLPSLATSSAYNVKKGAISNISVEEAPYYGSNRTNDLGSANVDFAITADGSVLAIYDSDTSITRSEFMEKYSAFQLVYPLATPITYQLTPTELKTLLSTNNIWSNTNDVTEVSYAVHDSAMIRAAKRRMAMAVSNPDFLPSSYRRLTGIIFDAKTYYLFNNFHLQGNDTVRISVSVNKSCNVFGCYSSGSAQDNYSLYATTSNTGKYLRYNGETYKSRWASTDQGQRYNIVITPTGSSGMPPSQDDTWEEKNFVSEAELCVGTTAVSASSSKLDGIIYGNFIVDNRLCAVPVERISDGTVGYYEMYTHTFYEPIGTNPEKLGYA